MMLKKLKNSWGGLTLGGVAFFALWGLCWPDQASVLGIAIAQHVLFYFVIGIFLQPDIGNTPHVRSWLKTFFANSFLLFPIAYGLTQTTLLALLLPIHISLFSIVIFLISSDKLYWFFNLFITGALVAFFSRPGLLLFQFEAGIVLAALIAVVSIRIKFLTVDGALAAFLLGTVVFGLGGLAWSIPLIAFFILSSSLSKVGKQRKAAFDLVFEKSSYRDKWQVFANGGLTGVVVVIWFFYPHAGLYLVYLGVLAAITADTWATEIGVLFKGQPRLITTFENVDPGTSGGITWPGTIGGAGGALLIAVIGITSGNSYFLNIEEGFALMAVVFSGVIGNCMDSLTGVWWQAQYECAICHQKTERLTHCNGIPTQLVSGLSWMDNDRVNLVCATTGGLTVLLFLWISSLFG